MTRAALFAAGLTAALTVAARAELPVAPAPREVRPDGTRVPPPGPPPVPVPKSANPLETVEKIIKNSGEITERLGKHDTGADTRKTQDETLALIDSLLQQDNPPPKSGDNQGQNKDKPKDGDQKNPSGGTDQKPQDKPKDGKDQKENKGGGGGMGPGGMDKPPKGKDQQPPEMPMPMPTTSKDDAPKDTPQPKTGPMNEPMGGDEDRDPQRDGRRPRLGAKDKEQDKKGGGEKDKKEPGGMAGNEPKNDKGGPGKKPQEPKDPMAGAGGKSPGMPKGPIQPRPSIPLDDDVIKQVWGSHRELLRMQVPQYYTEQFMPRYKELLRLYYTSLAEAAKSSGGGK